MAIGATLKSIIIGGSGIILLGVSIYFFMLGINLMGAGGGEPRVAASLLATLVGFSTLSASVTLLRTWALTHTLEKVGKGEK
ncbi:MAG: hypothetical protein F7C32_01665 [Desulfurococcales archaeon]|nr:hypothetical protein [Desulfurococcales archaeon]